VSFLGDFGISHNGIFSDGKCHLVCKEFAVVDDETVEVIPFSAIIPLGSKDMVHYLMSQWASLMGAEVSELVGIVFT